MKRYYSRVDWVYSWIIFVPMLIAWILVIPVIISGSLSSQIVLSLTMIGSTILIASIYTNTYYIIDTEYLHWRSGPFKGKIDIHKIRSIGKYDSMLGISSMMKPALGRNPLKIQYEKYEDMPFSPSDEKGFIDDLIKVNSAIEIKTSESDQLEESALS